MTSVSTTPLNPSPELIKRYKEYFDSNLELTEQDKVARNCNVVEVPNSKKSGYSSILRNSINHPEKEIRSSFDPEVDNYYTAFECIANLLPDNPLLGTRLPVVVEKENKKTTKFDDKYTFLTTKQIQTKRTFFGAGLVRAVTNHKHYSKYLAGNFPEFPGYNENKPHKWVVSIFSTNRTEWAITDLACQAYNICNTALYDTLGPDSTVYILQLLKSPVVVCSSNHVLPLINLKKAQPEELKTLLTIVSMDELSMQEDYPLYQLANDVDINLHTFKQLEALGEKNPVPLTPVGKDDLYTVSFTSGTTGLPKGVVIPQKMLMASLTFIIDFISTVPGVNPFKGNPAVYLSFLPLAHIYERVTFAFSLASGCRIGFPSNFPFSLIEDMKILKPHYFVSVPRILTRIESSLKEVLSNSKGLKKWYIESTLRNRMQKQELKDFEKDELLIYDSLVTKKLRAAIGFDNVSVVVTGSAPISIETIKFMRAALSVGVCQGYGSTEVCGGNCISFSLEKDFGSSGVIGSVCEMRLRDLPAMNYTSDSETPKGELMIRGPQVFEYYFQRDEETKKCFDEDGFFHTGDVVLLDKKNRIYIVDRVKNFFKLQQGEYVTPERIENIYLSKCPIISQIFVYGDSLESYLVGIVGLDPLSIAKFLTGLDGVSHEFKLKVRQVTPKNVNIANFDEKEFEELIKFINDDLSIKKKIVLKFNDLIMKDEKKQLLQGFEKLHNLKIMINPLKPEENTVTPTFKIKRIIASKRFQPELKELYGEGSLVKGSKL